MEQITEETVKLIMNSERGFYIDFRKGQIHAGQDGEQWNKEQVKKVRDGY